MTKEEMRTALEAGEWVEAVFWTGNLQSIIKVWKYESAFILTWEEAPEGSQYDESKYTRDERCKFVRADRAIEFLDEKRIPLERFAIAK